MMTLWLTNQNLVPVARLLRIENDDGNNDWKWMQYSLWLVSRSDFDMLTSCQREKEECGNAHANLLSLPQLFAWSTSCLIRPASHRTLSHSWIRQFERHATFVLVDPCRGAKNHCFVCFVCFGLFCQLESASLFTKMILG